MPISTKSLWFPFGSGRGQELLAVCLPFAGGGASTFLPWQRQLDSVAIAPMQYPGHETRLKEPCLLDISVLVEQIANALQPLIQQPYVLIGYSMGALLAYSVAHRLAALGLPQPRALFALAHRAPDQAPLHPGLEQLPDAEFDAAVFKYGGLSPDVLANTELAGMVRRLLRADFTLASGPVPLRPLTCPMHVWSGQDDSAAPPDSAWKWNRFTTGGTSHRCFTGGHFFLRNDPAFMAVLRHELAKLAAQKYSPDRFFAAPLRRSEPVLQFQ